MMHSKGQSMLEYLILTVGIAFLIFAAFSPNGLLSKTNQKSEEYFKTGTAAITGEADPLPINGQWCEADWSKIPCVAGYKERTCACPRPAFGGNACSGDSFQKC